VLDISSAVSPVLFVISAMQKYASKPQKAETKRNASSSHKRQNKIFDETIDALCPL
jgi:hypothetical protein